VENPPPRQSTGKAASAKGVLAAIEGIPPAQAEEVGRCLAENDTKGALKKAKALHNRLGTAESEAFLVATYDARIEALRSAGLEIEAKALSELVEKRYRRGKGTLRKARSVQAAQSEALETLVGHLARADLPAERVRQIEQRVRREVTDLASLATCRALPADHPLRRSAGALWRAFEAVTAGPVEDGQLALRKVPRRSPLSDWKLLIRAMACFHRRDDAACLRLLDAMDARSAAARLVGPLRAMVSGRGASELDGPAADLALAVTGEDASLRQALEDLEEVLLQGDLRRLKGGIRRAVKRCASVRRDLLDRLKQLVSIRCFLLDCPVEKVIAALGGNALHDAHFWRLFARATEGKGDPIGACALWEEFRRVAVHEGWFSAGGPEEAAVYVHMTELLHRLPPDDLRRLQRRFEYSFEGFDAYYTKGQPASVRAAAPDRRKPLDCYFLDPGAIFERLAAGRPDADVYERWLTYARGEGFGTGAAETVAERWHEAFPADSRPLLFLMDAAEERKAFTKALRYLEKAEARDGLSPAVKRARLRLWVSKAIRHVRQGKWHLAEKDFAEIESLPASREGDRPALVTALRCASAQLSGDEAAAAAFRAELAGLMGDDAMAVVLLTCVLCGKARGRGKPLGAAPSGAAPTNGEALLDAVGRSFAVCREFGLPVPMPRPWASALVRTLNKNGAPRDPVQLRAVAEAALELREGPVTYAATGAGLRQGGTHRARFLLLRGQSLPRFDQRREDCLQVAAELARRQRDTDLLAEVIDEAQNGLPWFSELDLEIDEEMIDDVLARETKATRSPWGSAASPPTGASLPPGPTRGRRGAARQPKLFEMFLDDEDLDDEFCDDEDFDEDGFFNEEGLDDDEDDWDVLPPVGPFGGPPPEAVEALLEIVMRNGGRLPSPQEIRRSIGSDPDLRRTLEEILGPCPFPPGPSPSSPRPGRKKPRRGRKGKR